jgi:hypothetical protein
MTKRGEATRDVIRDAVRSVEAEWAAALGTRELEELRALLARLSQVVRESPGAARATQVE